MNDCVFVKPSHLYFYSGLWIFLRASKKFLQIGRRVLIMRFPSTVVAAVLGGGAMQKGVNKLII